MKGLKADEIEKLHALLQRKFEEAGRGSLKRVERAVGVKPGFFRVSRFRKIINFGVLLAALDELGIDPGEFFAELFGHDPGDEPGSGQSATPQPSRPTSGGRSSSKDRDTSEAKGADVLAWLEEMDSLRYTDAEAAICQLWSRIGDISEREAAPYLAVLGSAYRAIGNVSDAAGCLLLAQEHAAGDDVAFGDVLQRRAYVSAHSGSFEVALGFAEQAAGVFARAGCWPRFGEAFVDQTNFLLHLEATERAERALEVARRYVPRSEVSLFPRLQRYLFAIEEYSITVRLSAGDLQGALEHVGSARKLAPDPVAQGMIWAAAGEIYKRLGTPELAARAYQRELELVAKSPVDALLASVDLADALARCGRRREALTTAKNITKYFASLDKSPVARAAVMELWSQVRRDEFSSRTLKSAREAIRAAQAETHTDTLGDRVRRLRRLRGISRPELAEVTGVPADSIRKIESGAMPGTRYAPKLSAWILATRPELRLQTKQARARHPAC